MRDAFRFKLAGNLLICLLAMGLLFFCQDFLIRLYLHGTGDSAELTLALTSAKEFLVILLFSLPFFAISQAYASSLREIGQNHGTDVCQQYRCRHEHSIEFLIDFWFIFLPHFRGARCRDLHIDCPHRRMCHHDVLGTSP